MRKFDEHEHRGRVRMESYTKTVERAKHKKMENLYETQEQLEKRR